LDTPCRAALPPGKDQSLQSCSADPIHLIASHYTGRLGALCCRPILIVSRSQVRGKFALLLSFFRILLLLLLLLLLLFVDSFSVFVVAVEVVVMFVDFAVDCLFTLAVVNS
jgi:hypothetical protein